MRCCPAGSRPGASSCIRPERPSADRGTWLAIEAAGAQARHLLIDLGQALQHQAEIQSREFAVGAPFQAGAAQAGPAMPIRGDGRRGDGRLDGVRHGRPPGCR